MCTIHVYFGQTPSQNKRMCLTWGRLL